MKAKKVIFIISLIVLVLALAFRTKFDKSNLKNISNGEVTVIGHGGLGFANFFPFVYLPSNSFGSLSNALLEKGADGLEVDLHMTKDGKFVLYHDSELGSKTSREGCIETMNYEELISIDYELGPPYDWFQSEKLIGLDSLIAFCKKQKKFPILHFDIRNASSCLNDQENGEWEKSFAKKLIDQLNLYKVPQEKILIISLSREFLKAAIRYKCPYPLSVEEVGTFERGLKWCLEHDIKYLTIKPKLLLSKKNSAQAHQHGIKVITFGAKSRSGNKKLLELNPDMIQTNNIEALRDLLNYTD